MDDPSHLLSFYFEDEEEEVAMTDGRRSQPCVLNVAPISASQRWAVRSLQFAVAGGLCVGGAFLLGLSEILGRSDRIPILLHGSRYGFILAWAMFFGAVLAGFFSMIGLILNKAPFKYHVYAVGGIAVGLIVTSSNQLIPTGLNAGRQSVLRANCAANLTVLGEMLQSYAEDHNGLWPDRLKWRDLIKGISASEYLFCCPSTPIKNACTYAMNANLPDRLADTPSDFVVLFDAAMDSNPVGRPHTAVCGRHIRNKEPGCMVLFADGRVEFVPEDRIGSVLWAIPSPDESELTSISR